MRIWNRVVKRLLHALYRKRIPALLLILVGFAGGEYFLWRSTVPIDVVSAAGNAPIEVAVQNVQQARGGDIMLTLKEKNGARRISMNVSETEAITIAGVVAKQRGQRLNAEPPQTYDFMHDVIEQMGAKVDRVVVNDANQTQYFAQVIVSANGDTKIVATRPAEAVALAMKSNAPIFVEDRVLDQFGAKGS